VWGDLCIGKQPLQLTGARTVETDFDGRRYLVRHHTCANRKLHVEQHVKLSTTQLFAQIAQPRQPGALVDGDKLHTLDEFHDASFSLSDDPGQVCGGPYML
jgi:hypothetical protein